MLTGRVAWEDFQDFFSDHLSIWHWRFISRVLSSVRLEVGMHLCPTEYWCRADKWSSGVEDALWEVSKRHKLSIPVNTFFQYCRGSRAHYVPLWWTVALRVATLFQHCGKPPAPCLCVLQNSGMMVPLDELIRLKEKYKFRILVDESNSLGVLGKTGRGITQHFNIPVNVLNHRKVEEGIFREYSFI